MKDDIIKYLEDIYSSSILDNNKKMYLKIGSIDNPGWGCKITFDQNLLIDLDAVKFIHIDHSETDWIYWRMQKPSFEFACSTGNFADAMNIMLKEFLNIKNTQSSDEIITRLDKWNIICHGDDPWDWDGTIRIETKSNMWQVKMDFGDLIYPYEKFVPFEEKKSISDWYKYWMEGTVFYGESTPNNLHKILEGFFENIDRFEKEL